jgi:hypothetical protein
MLHDYSQGADALKRRQTGGENSDPSNKLYITANDILAIRHQITAIKVLEEIVLRDIETGQLAFKQLSEE